MLHKISSEIVSSILTFRLPATRLIHFCSDWSVLTCTDWSFFCGAITTHLILSSDLFRQLEKSLKKPTDDTFRNISKGGLSVCATEQVYFGDLDNLPLYKTYSRSIVQTKRAIAHTCEIFLYVTQSSMPFVALSFTDVLIKVDLKSFVFRKK